MSKNPPSLNRALYAFRQSARRGQSICNAYAAYECLKAVWVADNPQATQRQYDAAMQRLARECGV